MNKTVVCACTMLAITVFALAQPTPETRAKIDETVKGLSAEGWKARQAAQEKLVTFGQDAVPILKKLAESGEDEEVRTRAAAALRQIEENAQVGASTITIKMKDAKVADIFAEIAKQARCEFPTEPKNLFDTRGTLTMDLERVNFWVAFKEACTKAGVGPQAYGNEQHMTLRQGVHMQWNGPSVTSGPFLIVANRLYRSHSVDLANPNNVQNDFQFTLTAFCEPKVKVISSSSQVQVEEAVDDKGNSLVSNDRSFGGFYPSRQWMWHLNTRLAYPENAGKVLKKFRGSVKFLVQTKSETLDVPDILTVKNMAKTIAGRRLVIKECKKNGEMFEVSITFFRDNMNDADWQAIHNQGYSMKLLDKEGRALSMRSSSSGGSNTEMNYTGGYARDNWHGGEQGKIGEPHRLVWEVPLETREMAVAFEFKDLPLP